jgi:predicted N-formylglutamate amidohydrolase
LVKLVDDLPDASSSLLVAGDPNPVIAGNLSGVSPLVLLGDHAGRAIPQSLGELGLTFADRDRHIALDIGVEGLGALVSARLDAVFIRQTYSRLVIDCNRAPGRPDSIAAFSDGSTVPGNRRLSAADATAREAAVFRPYHDRIAAELDVRAAQGRRTILVSLHSFTPVMGAGARPWRFGVLHRGDSPFSRAMLAALRRREGEAVGDNQPYSMDGADFTIPHHADARGLDYLELEVRQDLIADTAGQVTIATILAEALTDALSQVEPA